MDTNLKKFLDKNKLITVSLENSVDGLWTFTAFYGNNQSTIYFVSKHKTRHIKMLERNSNVAFSISWYNQSDLDDIEGIQGLGHCSEVRNPKDLINGFKALYKKMPEWKDWINLENIFSNIYGSRMYKIDTSYIKYTNSKEKIKKEFKLNKLT